MKSGNMLICLWLMLAFPTTVSAAVDETTPWSEDIRFVNLSVEDGLTSIINYDIIQDSRGFIWIAGANGLNRYDAHGIRAFQHDPDRPDSLTNNRVNIVFEDSRENLWAGTQNGLDRFDRNLETFEHIKQNAQSPENLSETVIRAIFEDSFGNLWIGDNSGLKVVFVDEHGTFLMERQSGFERIFGTSGVYAIAETPDHQLWLGTDNGLCRWDRDSGNRRYFRSAPDASGSLSSDKIRVLYVDKSGTLWAGTEGGGLNRFEPNTETFTVFRNHQDDPDSISNDSITDIYEDRHDCFWIATRFGLNRMDRSTRRFRRYVPDSGNPDMLIGYMMTGIWEDRDGRLWFANLNAGVDILDPNRKAFRIHRYNPERPVSLNSSKIRGLIEDKEGNIWIGAALGKLNRLNPHIGSFTYFQHEPDNPNNLPLNNVVSMYEDTDGTLWLAAYGGGLLRFDPATQEFIHYRHDPENPNSLGNNSITWVTGAMNGRLWLSGLGGGLDLFDPESGIFTHFRHDPNDPSSIAQDQVVTATQMNNGELWACTYGEGISVLIPETGQFRHYRHDPGDPDSLSDNTTRYALEDSQGRIWVVTNFGLNLFVSGNETFQHYFEKTGLPDNVLFGIVEDNDGMLWISTNNGLARFDPEQESFRNYNEADGLASNSFYSFSFARTRDGHLLFGSNDGLTMFHPGDIRDNPYPPEVVLTDFELFNKSAPIGGDSPLQRSITESDELILPYHQNVIGFHFAALNYTAPQKNRYAFKLDGFDQKWTETDSSRPFAIYSNLDSGTYQFKVKGSNNDGIWNDQGSSLTLIITPPWWETWWAYTLYGIIGIVALGVVIQLRTQSLNRKRRELEQQVAERTQELLIANELALEAKERAEDAQRASEAANRAKSEFLANMSHELRTPLNAVLGFSQLLGRSPNLSADEHASLHTIHRSGEHLLRLINDVLDMSKIEAGRTTLNESSFDLHGLLDDLGDMMGMRAREKNLHLLIERTPDVPRAIRSDEIKLRQVLLNLLGNAIKFTEEGGVHVLITATSASESDGLIRLQFEVRDTGPGIAPDEQCALFEPFVQTTSGRQSSEGTGLGLPISRKFVQLMGGELTVTSDIGKGTSFLFDIVAYPAELSETAPPPCCSSGDRPGTRTAGLSASRG